MSATNRLGKGMKFISIILGSLLMGFMWRARGSHGFGAFWGIVAAGSVFTLLIYAFYGNRAKSALEHIPMGAVLMGCTVPAWGCVITMPGGIIRDFTNSANARQVEISQVKGTIMMLLLGFSLICIFGIFIGTVFSERKYGIKHYLVYIAAFFAVEILIKLSIAHNIMPVLASEVTSGFSEGLAKAGASGTLRQVYINHFGDMSFAKSIPFGRYYYECVEHIAYAFGALAMLITAVSVFRDRVTFFISFCINLVSALAITVSDYFQICEYKTGIISGISIPSSLRITSWGLWEFFTGFFIGAGVMLIIALLPAKYTAGKKYRSEPVINNRVVRFGFNLLLWEFVFVVVPVRALFLRIARMLEEYGYIQEEDLPGIVVTAAVSLIIGVFLIGVLKRNILDKNLPVPFKTKPFDFASKMLPLISLYYGAVYFFTLDASIPAFFYRIIKSPSHSINMTGIEYFWIYLSAFIMFEIIYIPVKKRLDARR